MKHLILVFFTLFFLESYSQNTVGILTNNEGSYNGYTLFSPLNSTETYLINNCGEVVHQWSSNYTPAASVYLLENGNLLRTGKIANPNITFGGVGGHIELFDWDNNLLWEYTYSSFQHTQHHDIFPLPNGNILMLAVDTMLEQEAIDEGRDPTLILDQKIYNEKILELEPVGSNQANIVWEWNIKDHLVQDFDSNKNNFGVVADHPELLDFNFLNADIGHANWLHINSLQYNADLDQIILSSRILSEIYIIDHSTTTAEAALHTGGTYNKGGDFLYRWGNPEAYDMGDFDDRTLFSQHHPHWIPNGLIDGGKLLLFNNGNSIRFSSVDIITPPTESEGVYIYDPVNGYGPSSTEWTYVDPIDPENFFSSILSSAQRLPNGNTFICDGDSGYFFELNSSNEIVWEYINPDTTNGILAQGDLPIANFVFRAKKFNIDFSAFIGKDLILGNPIELNPDISNCTILGDGEFEIAKPVMFPNPVRDILTIRNVSNINTIQVYNSLGGLVAEIKSSYYIDLSHIPTGLYIVKVETNNNMFTKKLLKN